MTLQTETASSAYDTLKLLSERIEELKAENDKLKHELTKRKHLPVKVVRSRTFYDCSLKGKSRLIEARLCEELKLMVG
ncbi:MAG: hypothetical protein ABL933_09450 [Methyloglobulus sp.]|nr:hypothetical protein [Methyloglobulus sp.]